jgi:magnesium transporter
MLFLQKKQGEELMSVEIETQPWEILKAYIINNRSNEIIKFFEKTGPAETARSVAHLDEESREKLIVLLNPKNAAALLHTIPDEQAADIIEKIPAQDAAAIIDQMPVDEQADILADVKSEGAEAILDAMPRKDASMTRQVMEYTSDTAGAIMSLEYLAYTEHTTCAEIINDLQAHQERYSDYEVQYTYIVSKSNRLIGVLRMRDLILAKRSAPVRSFMIKKPLHVKVTTSLDELIQIFEENNFIGIPVTDKQNRLIGVVRRAQVLEASTHRAEISLLKRSGITQGEEFRSMPLMQRSFRRLSWLSINIFLNVIAASVIAFYQDTLSAVIALAVFLPIISDMSGCSGNQSVAVSIRELTLGLIRPFEVFRVIKKELGIGIINGIILGFILGMVAFLWQNNPYLGIVIGVALTTNTIVAVALGGSIPLILKSINVDPALASSPILTTITDMCGFFFALYFATLALKFLS